MTQIASPPSLTQAVLRNRSYPSFRNQRLTIQNRPATRPPSAEGQRAARSGAAGYDIAKTPPEWGSHMTTMIPAWVNGKLTPVEKLEVHQRGLRHKAISVFVMRGRETLIQRRALGKYHTPGLWANACCTHPFWEEPALTCAKRRLDEELGISGLRLDHRDQVEYRADVGGGLTEHELVEIYVAEAVALTDVTPNPAEVMDTAWVDLSDLARQTQTMPERFTPWLRIYLAEHMDSIFTA